MRMATKYLRFNWFIVLCVPLHSEVEDRHLVLVLEKAEQYGRTGTGCRRLDQRKCVRFRNVSKVDRYPFASRDG